MSLIQPSLSPSLGAKSLLRFGCLLLSASALFSPYPAFAADQQPSVTLEEDKDKPASVLQADILNYDEDKKTITALGHVEVMYGDQLLRADRIIYFQESNVVHADGNVTLLQASGDVLFTDQAELTSDLAEGFIDNVGMLFNDNSRLAAVTARRYQGRYLVVKNGIYTACNVCKESVDAAPLWQLKARRLTHDNLKKDVIYRDATLEMAGIPVFYTPYFSHPDPSVKRRQGLLAPNMGNSSNLGTFLRAPYYIDIAPNQDLTLTPIFSSKDKAQLSANWRSRYAQTKMNWTTSFTSTDLINDSGVNKGQTLRGHVFGDVQHSFDKNWRAGTHVALTTDKSYLSRYSIAHDDVLVNKAYLERFEGRDYLAANMFYFQDLRPGTQLTEPLVTPEISFSRLGQPGKTFGGRWSLGGNFLMTERNSDVTLAEQGPDVRRFSLNGGWKRQLTSDTGLLTQFSSFVRSDLYYADNVIDPDDATKKYNNVTRARPYAQADVTFRYPLGRRGENYQQILEPIVQLTAAPQVSTDRHLPNEDSLDVELDEANLFSENRFPGLDKIEGGTRGAYGLRHSLVTDAGGRIEFIGGQVFRTTTNKSFSDETSLRNKSSSYLGRLDFVPSDWVNASYGFLLDKDTLSSERQSLNASVGVPLFRPFVNYLSLNKAIVDNTVTPLQEVTAGFHSSFLKYYSFSVYQNRAIEPNPGVRYTTFSANYSDECFQFGLTASRNNTERADIASGDSIVFHFYLRNIGGFETDSSTSAAFAER